MHHFTLFNAKVEGNLSGWTVVNDTVMGGRSTGMFARIEHFNALYSGVVSLENNGGFSSVKCEITPVRVKGYSHFNLFIKGDGQEYQFKIKSRRGDEFSYRYHLRTHGKKQVVEIPFDTMYPCHRGRKLDQPNFPGEIVEEIGFLIANKKSGPFTLEIMSIEGKWQIGFSYNINPMKSFLIIFYDKYGGK